jgi:hypothetical protein
MTSCCTRAFLFPDGLAVLLAVANLMKKKNVLQKPCGNRAFCVKDKKNLIFLKI